MQRIADNTVMYFLTGQAEAGIVRRSVYDEREGDGLAAFAAVVGTHPDIVIWVGSTALVDLIQDCSRILHVKQKYSMAKVSVVVAVCYQIHRTYFIHQAGTA
jgi:hypothetical protein